MLALSKKKLTEIQLLPTDLQFVCRIFHLKIRGWECCGHTGLRNFHWKIRGWEGGGHTELRNFKWKIRGGEGCGNTELWDFHMENPRWARLRKCGAVEFPQPLADGYVRSHSAVEFPQLPRTHSRVCKGAVEIPHHGYCVGCLGLVPCGISTAVHPTAPDSQVCCGNSTAL